MSLVQAVFSSLSTENTSGNFTIAKIGFFKKWVHMKLWDTNIRSWDDGQTNSPVLTFELSVDRTVYRAQEQTFARFSKTMWLNFMWLNTTGKSLSVCFTFETLQTSLISTGTWGSLRSFFTLFSCIPSLVALLGDICQRTSCNKSIWEQGVLLALLPLNLLSVRPGEHQD